MNLKSHTKKEVLSAYQAGTPVWSLDTGSFGEDDILIGEHKDVLQDVLSFYDLPALPENWELRKITEEEFLGYF